MEVYHSPIVIGGVMEQIYDDVVEMLAQQIVNATEKKLSSNGYDKTYEGRVLSSLGSNKYTVLINGVNYDVYSNNDLTYSTMEYVWVTAPCGNKSKQYISGRKR